MLKVIAPQQPVNRAVFARDEIVEAVGNAERYFSHSEPPLLF
jgi:hypothetical protein